MNTNNNALITMLQINSGMRLVKVAFLSDAAVPQNNHRYYTYKCMTVSNPAINDLVVVEARGGYGLATIVDADVNPLDLPQDLTLSHVVCRVDRDPLTSIKQQENTILRSFAEAELKRRMEEIFKDAGFTTLPTFDLSPKTPSETVTPSVFEDADVVADEQEAGFAARPFAARR